VNALAQVRRLARSIDAATPPQRDRAVDALRALAIAGVIGGHWLVTALVSGAGNGTSHSGAVLSDDSPLASMHALAPLSWIFQTLAVFFLVGGYSAARGYRGEYLPWLRKRMVRLARPVAALAAVWIPVTVGMCLAGVPGTTVRTLLFLVISPLWFLCVYAGLTAMIPAAMWLATRFGAWAAAILVAVVAVADLVRFGLGGPSWVGWVNLPAGWFVPYLLGIAWGLGSLRGRRGSALMLAGCLPSENPSTILAQKASRSSGPRLVTRPRSAGMVFINGNVTSYPELPFGGVKKSGHCMFVPGWVVSWHG
jgi:hypothetical protein